jgi:hypothetical protein
MDSAVAARAMSAAHSSGVKAGTEIGSQGGLMIASGVVVICVIGGAWLWTVVKNGADQEKQVLEAQVKTKDATLSDIAARDARAAQQRNAGTFV